MEIGIIYRDLFQNPYAPALYRKLYKYYLSQNMTAEANAFAELLRIRFDEIIDDSDDTHNSEE